MPNEPDRVTNPSSPVRDLPGDDDVRPGAGLCLSGGGYRAMVFHIGVLWRLNELGYLPKLERVSSVSGGSITAGVLGARWGSLAFDPTGVAKAFDDQVVRPLRDLASQGDHRRRALARQHRGRRGRRLRQAFVRRRHAAEPA